MDKIVFGVNLFTEVVSWYIICVETENLVLNSRMKLYFHTEW